MDEHPRLTSSPLKFLLMPKHSHPLCPQCPRFPQENRGHFLHPGFFSQGCGTPLCIWDGESKIAEKQAASRNIARRQHRVSPTALVATSLHLRGSL